MPWSSLSGAGDTPLGDVTPPLSRLMLLVRCSTGVTGGSGESGFGGMRLTCRDSAIRRPQVVGVVARAIAPGEANAVVGGGTEMEILAGLCEGSLRLEDPPRE